TGYGHYIIARPEYYDIMLKQVPSNKILFGHRVLNISEEDNRVTVHLSNNQTYEGDIIVGADGAYSAIRQRIYEKLQAKGVLPKSDHEDLPFSSTSLVGQTRVLDPEEFPIVNKPHCQFLGFLGKDKPYTAMEQRFRNSENSGEWGAAPAQTMCENTRNFPLQLDDRKKRTMRDLYDLTPKELISKVMLEEKVFKTWHHGRYVLMGDACHKLSPSGGHGAVTAMHDAITLANLIYVMPTKTSEDIARIFEEYKTERYPAVMESYKNSQIMGKAIGKGILSKMVRYRPQVGFLPNIPLQGTVVPFVSPSEQKARELFEKQQK
ncbi:hypothetical protein BGZ47_007545, partial [Haplosporangium gracile]